MTEQYEDLILPLGPNANNNGSGNNLIDQCIDMIEALENTIKSLRQGMPNGRDYSEPHLTDEARGQHYDRIAKIESVKQEILHIAKHVSRTRRK